MPLSGHHGEFLKNNITLSDAIFLVISENVLPRRKPPANDVMYGVDTHTDEITREEEVPPSVVWDQ